MDWKKMIIMMTSTSSKSVAEEIAERLVEGRLSPCVQIIEKMIGIYMWKGRPEKTAGYLLIIKTSDQNMTEVEGIILDIHDDEVPEIIRMKSEIVNKAYGEWFWETLK